jgi:hypothetical protein
MNFEELQEELFKVKDDSLAFIRYFERNSDDIEKLDDSDGEQKFFKLKMNGDYGLCLANSGNTVKAIKVLEKFIPKFEQLTTQRIFLNDSSNFSRTIKSIRTG